MNCATVRQLLNEYVESTLTDSVSQSVSDHLRKCRQCAAEEHLLLILRSLPRRAAPITFTDGVMERLLEVGDTVERATISSSSDEAGLLSTLAYRSGLRPAWKGMKMMARSTKFARYVPRPSLRLRTGADRARSLTKLPLAVGFRW